MKKLFIYYLVLLICVTFSFKLEAQQLQSGNYTSVKNAYTVSVQHNGDVVTITEPNRVNTYRKQSDGITYVNEDPKYTQFFIQINADDHFFAGKGSNALERYNLSSKSMSTSATTLLENCPLYDKYLKKSQDDEIEVQAWSFCAAAALANCSKQGEERENYMTAIVTALKSIIVNQNQCPCVDVIPTAIWNSILID